MSVTARERVCMRVTTEERKVLLVVLVLSLSFFSLYYVQISWTGSGVTRSKDCRLITLSHTHILDIVMCVCLCV